MIKMPKWAWKAAMKVKAHLPAILTGAGIVGMGAGTVLACSATVKSLPVVQDAKEDLQKIKVYLDDPEHPEYTNVEYRKDKTKIVVRTGIDVAKNYILPTAILGTSAGCFIGSHRILSKENAAISAAYIALNESYKKYRDRVSRKFGKDKEAECYQGIKADPENGELADDVQIADTNDISVYGRFFDETNPNWKKNPEMNLMFLRSQQNTANDMLHSRGHIFLNEVYDLLDLPRTEAGAYVGWVDGMGDSFVDFGIYNYEDALKRDFVNGFERAILLDFNVDGPIMYIFDKLGKKN